MLAWLVPALFTGLLYFASTKAKGLFRYVLWIAVFALGTYTLMQLLADWRVIMFAFVTLALYTTYKVITYRRKQRKEQREREERERGSNIHIHNHWERP